MRSKLEARCLSIGRSAFPELVAEGERRILREVAELPSPWRTHGEGTAMFHVGSSVPVQGSVSTTMFGRCDWCGVQASRGDGVAVSHPDNGCLWPRAIRAKESK